MSELVSDQLLVTPDIIEEVEQRASFIHRLAESKAGRLALTLLATATTGSISLAGFESAALAATPSEVHSASPQNCEPWFSTGPTVPGSLPGTEVGCTTVVAGGMQQSWSGFGEGTHTTEVEINQITPGNTLNYIGTVPYTWTGTSVTEPTYSLAPGNYQIYAQLPQYPAGTSGSCKCEGDDDQSEAATIAVGGASTTPPPVKTVPSNATQGYWEVASGGEVDNFGDANYYGGMNGNLNGSIINMASTPDGKGYWLVGSDGGIFTFGDAKYFGSTGKEHLNKPIVGMASTPDGRGYWLVASDGGIFTFGDAKYDGSEGADHLNAPIVGMASTPDGKGYWLVASDGGMFTFGDAAFYGSEGGQHLNAPIVGISTTPDGKGYRLVASDGGMFTFGDAAFYGSEGGQHLNAPIVGISTTPDGKGYLEYASDSGIFTFGDAIYYGKTALSATATLGAAAAKL